ncbi:MAG: PhzF family phenazine biosynthesis protein [bacterium]
MTTSLAFHHVDVFTQRPYGGNSLAVFPDARGVSARQMLQITKELRHFEAIFLEPTDDANTVRARVFDLFEELPFAGHPVIGAAAVLHHAAERGERCDWLVVLPPKTVTITTERTPSGYFGMLDQGAPEFIGALAGAEQVARAFGLEAADLDAALPPEVISTGLRYLVVPVAPGALEKAHIAHDITGWLNTVGAQYAVLLDEASLEVRHWNNDGIIEDVATGSAAGTVGAYRLRHGLARGDETFVLHQGRFVGRPSTLRVRPEGTPERVTRVSVGGDVALVGRGVLEVLP